MPTSFGRLLAIHLYSGKQGNPEEWLTGKVGAVDAEGEGGVGSTVCIDTRSSRSTPNAAEAWNGSIGAVLARWGAFLLGRGLDQDAKRVNIRLGIRGVDWLRCGGDGRVS